MTPEQFCHWLQGHFELNGAKEISGHQAQIIRDHLSTVFNKVTPQRSPAFKDFVPGYPFDNRAVC